MAGVNEYLTYETDEEDERFMEECSRHFRFWQTVERDGGSFERISEMLGVVHAESEVCHG